MVQLMRDLFSDLSIVILATLASLVILGSVSLLLWAAGLIP